MANISEQPLHRELVAEALGTGLLVFFGIGAFHVAIVAGGLTGLAGLWPIAAIWGLGVGLAVYCTAAISGAHLNPAVTVALAVFRRFPRQKIAPYIGAQLGGAFLAATILYALFNPLIARFETQNNIVRGEADSEKSAMIYGAYFPNPAVVGTTTQADELVSQPTAFLAELLGTALLVLFIFALTDQHNENRPGRAGLAVCIGMGVTALFCIIAPLTQAGLNPARDFGPRLFSFFAGWSDVALPGP